MKKLKIKKCMTSFLMLAVMIVTIFGFMPKTNVFAATFSFTSTDSWRGDKAEKSTASWSPVGGSSIKYYVAYSTGHNYTGFFAISKGEPFSLSITNLKNDSITGTNHVDYTDSIVIDGVTYYYYALGNSYPGPTNDTNFYNYKWSGASGTCLFSGNHTDKDFVKYFITGKFPDDCKFDTTMTSTTEGSSDDPIEDKDIGTIVLKSHGFISTKNEQFMGDVSCSYDYYFKYKDKTSSGFSLTDNKYARTFIEVKVQNQCVLYNKDNKDIIEEYYPHYGEYYTYKKFPLESINNNTLRVGWGDIYSKWNDYSEHPLATNKKLAYRFMIRVVCTDSLTVIPDEKNGWYAGGWRSILFDGSKFVEETNGHVGEDGKWKDDKDDGHNNSSDKTSHNNESKDDVDKIMNDDSSSSSSISNIKSFLNDVGNVPKAIGKLFSFLPSWCTDFIAFGFVVLVALMIIKAIRG